VPQRKKTAREIQLAGNARKLSRAQIGEREVADRSAKPMEKRAELLGIFRDVSARRGKALADIKKRGAVLTVTKYSAKGNPYEVEIVNPNLRIAQQSERQVVDLAKMLQAFPTAPAAAAKPKTGLAALIDYVESEDEGVAVEDN